MMCGIAVRAWICDGAFRDTKTSEITQTAD